MALENRVFVLFRGSIKEELKMKHERTYWMSEDSKDGIDWNCVDIDGTR